MAGEPAAPLLSPSRATWFVLGALMLAEFTAAFELSMIYSAMNTMIRVFKDPVGVSWLITIYLLVSAISAAVCGRLGDIYGRRRLLVIVLGIALAGSVLSAATTHLGVIIAGRALQGLAGAALPLCYGLAREALDESRVPLGISVIASTATVAGGAGILLGGVIVDFAGWHAIFYASALMCALSILFVMLLVPVSKRRPVSGKLDYVGGILFVVGLLGPLLAISSGSRWGWLDIKTLGALGVGALVLFWWVRHELRVPEPLINVRLLATREIALCNIAFGFYAMGTLQMQVKQVLLQQPTWTGIGIGLNATTAGLLSLPGQITVLFVAPFAAWMCAKKGGRFAMIFSSIWIAASWVVVALFPSLLWVLVGTTLSMAIGTTIFYAAVPNIIVAATPADRTSEVTGMMQVSRSAAQALGAQITAALLASSTVTGATEGMGTFPSPNAMVMALWFIAGTTFVPIFIAIALRRPSRKPPAEQRLTPEVAAVQPPAVSS